MSTRAWRRAQTSSTSRATPLLRAAGAEAALRLAQAARRYGARVTVDLSTAHGIAELGRETMRGRVAALEPDVVFANEAEAEAFGQPIGAVWVVKRGARGCTVEQGGERRRARADRGRWRRRHDRRRRRVRRGLPARARPRSGRPARAGGGGSLRHARRGPAVSAPLRISAEVADALAGPRARRLPRDDARRPRVPGGRGLRRRRGLGGRRARRGRDPGHRRHPRRRARRRPERSRAAAFRRRGPGRAQGRSARPRGLLRAGSARAPRRSAARSPPCARSASR